MWHSQNWSGIACSRGSCGRSAFAKPLLLLSLLVLGALVFDHAGAQSPNSPGYTPPQAPWSAPPPAPPPRASTAPNRERIDRIESELAGVRQQRLRVEQAQRMTPDLRDPTSPGQQAADAARLAAEQARLQAREDQLRRELTGLQSARRDSKGN
jgi:hypothetical protein